MTYLVGLLLSLFGFGAPGGDEAAAAANGGVTVPIEDSSQNIPLPGVTAARGTNPPLVVIDPGHGGHDPGASAVADGVLEKDVTLALGKSIRDELASSGRVRAALTREDDRFLPLEQRYAIARRLGADLFISLHADAAPQNDTARGATIYTLSEVASDQEAALLARRENASDSIGGTVISRDPNVNLILIDLAQRESMATSARFAQVMHREASPIFRFQENWRRFAAFVVLKAPDIPAILFEAGYVSNREDLAYLTSIEGRRDIAIGLRRAIEAHFSARFLAPRAPNSR
jgi:N-acetylmuramoyl-L-alanine amidase